MTKFALGQSTPRLEDAGLLQGQGQYSDDVQLPNAAHAYVLRSPHAHARILRIDTGAAGKAPGVVSILTGAEVAADALKGMPCAVPIKNFDGTPRAEPHRPILAVDRVRHVGDPVALIVAETLAQARDASELIVVEYEPLPVVVDVVRAAQSGAPRLHPEMKDNVCFELHMGDAAAVDAAFKGAAHVTRLDMVNQRLVANPMEPRVALADYEAAADKSILYTPSQGTHLIKNAVEGILGIKGKLAVRAKNVGGAFGMKAMVHPEQALIVWASRRLKRAVRWTSDRSEGFLSDGQGRDHFTTAELALDGEGRFLALRATTHAALGGYMSFFSPVPPQSTFLMLPGVYRTPAVSLRLLGVLTNACPVDAYRGAGRPEGIFTLERLVDLAARELGIAPDEIRRRNFIRPEDLPYKTPAGMTYDSGDFRAVMERCMREADWEGFQARRAAAKKKGRLRGIGMALYIERCGGGGSDEVPLSVTADEVVMTCGAQDNGQGQMTSLVQVISGKLGVDAEKIRVIAGDSDLTPSGMTGGSRFAAVMLSATSAAADEVVAKGMEEAASLLEAARADLEFRDGRYWVAGTDRSVSIFEAARRAGAISTVHKRVPEALTFPNGCHIVEAEIDPDTGATTLVDYTIADDFGCAINPLLLAGQVHGGTVQGVGQALLEHAVYDDAGQLVTGSFMDYAMPRADDMPNKKLVFQHTLCKTNPLGVKGAGEAGTVGATPAVINAIVDALDSVGKGRDIEMPATRERVWQILNKP